MTQATARSEKNIILFVGEMPESTTLGIVTAIRRYERMSGRKLRLAILEHRTKGDSTERRPAVEGINFSITCDTNFPSSIAKALLPYHDQILAVTCRSEKDILTFRKVIPHVPYVRTPTADSLHWASDKIEMRRRLKVFDHKITPAFTVVNDTGRVALKKIEEKVGFPLVVKPAGLAVSLLVSICYHKEELEKVLKTTFRKIAHLYKVDHYKGEPRVLVEQFMEGEMYSIDTYVTQSGKVYCCPLVQVKTGRSIGFDDFFGYQQITPTNLKKPSIEAAEQVARAAVHALGLRSTTAHIELMKTEAGWKVIELGARVGGFRPIMYELSFGINHTINDILIRFHKKPRVPKKILGYTAALKFFAKQEGRLTKLTGAKKAEDLKSFKSISVNKKIGDMCRYAKNGGRSVFNIILFSDSRSKLLADIRRLEQMVKIETE